MTNTHDPTIYSGEFLRAWRHRLGITLAVVAEVSGVALPTISLVERGMQSEAIRGKIQRALRLIEGVVEKSGGAITNEELLASVSRLRHKTRARSASAGASHAAAQ